MLGEVFEVIGKTLSREFFNRHSGALQAADTGSGRLAYQSIHISLKDRQQRPLGVSCALAVRVGKGTQLNCYML